MSLRDRILAAVDIPEEVVHIPEWDVDILIRGLTGKARTGMVARASLTDGQVDFQRIYPELVIACTYDPESREPVFTADDEEFVMGKSGQALDRIAEAAIRLSGMDAKAVDVAGKDS